ncbi:hypothetical protein FA13DRAFT_1719550 [Coprinellus micaceus]|uniref:Uncharacterized protein n=1 Tax=Coprinellus micaceus TaxID=71717 RepID=A0A4Y7SCW7_COPMI|nr:hypothetical protein FA13DRAFT_1719550 [Coprinellus micaceus]
MTYEGDRLRGLFISWQSPEACTWKNASDHDLEATEPYGSASLGPKPEARRTYEKALTQSGKWKLGRISSQIVQTGSKQLGKTNQNPTYGPINSPAMPDLWREGRRAWRQRKHYQAVGCHQEGWPWVSVRRAPRATREGEEMWSKTVEERGRDALCQGEGSWEEAQNPPSAFARRVQNKRPIRPKDSLVGAWRWEGRKLGTAGYQRVHGQGRKGMHIRQYDSEEVAATRPVHLLSLP